MLDASAGGHPLSIASMDHPSISGAVAMLDRPLNDECNRLDAAMWVKREYPLGRPILGHQDEGIGERGVRCVDQTARAMSGDLSRYELGVVDARYFSNKHGLGVFILNPSETATNSRTHNARGSSFS
jgi:hypothetical protein